ncbi:MAG: Adenine specific DNA methyltransferase, partial [Parcubacteria group bacterium GW2011_GWA2_47_10b]
MTTSNSSPFAACAVSNVTRESLSSISVSCVEREASERSYYPVLENLLNEFPKEAKKYSVLVESRKSSVGIPDFKVETSKNLLIGYIEAKDLGKDLDRLSKGEQEQIEKYLKEYPKLIVTNFIEFRLYENGEKVDSVLISQPITLKLKQPVLTNEPKFKGLLERFYSTIIPKVYSSKQLAELLARKTHVLRDLVREEIDLGDNETTSTEELLDAFKKTLRPDISEDDFADMYAQTVTYGLFSARLNAGEKDFNRATAYDYIPQTIPLLKRIFFLISGQNIQQHIKWQADEIAEILANTDIDKIQNEFFKQGKGRDPIIHFYETFLSEYDPKERAKRGVYYTPEPVVSYITKSIHKLLKYKFMKKDGFADNSVTVLDPAAGTLTFLANAIYLAKDELVSRYGSGSWNSLVKEHILKNFYAFEILMAPYTVGHLKIALLLKESGYEMTEQDRFKLYLTNTLDFEKVEELPLLMLAKEITDESKKAFDIKTKEPVLV